MLSFTPLFVFAFLDEMLTLGVSGSYACSMLTNFTIKEAIFGEKNPNISVNIQM